MAVNDMGCSTILMKENILVFCFCFIERLLQMLHTEVNSIIWELFYRTLLSDKAEVCQEMAIVDCKFIIFV